MNKGGRAKAMMAPVIEGPTNAPMPKGGEVRFGYAPAGRKGKKA